MKEFTKKIYEYCIDRGLIYNGMKLIVGVSGGADSVCLLRILKEFGDLISLDISCVHVEHGIRGEESREDMRFVQTLCEDLGVPLTIYEADAPGKAKEMSMTLEEAARYIRYEVFNKELSEKKADAIAVAHHMGDQTETVLFNLIRGSGLKGIAGMSPCREKIIRPLLKVSRCEIEEYLTQIGQEYCTDSTNSDVLYSRNGIRGIVIPELEKIVSKASEHIVRTADEVREADEYIRGIARQVYGRAYNDPKLNIEVIKDEPDIIKRYVIRMVLSHIYSTLKDLEAVHVYDVLELCNKQSGKSISLPGRITAKREGDHIIFCEETKRNPASLADKQISLCLDEETEVEGYGIFRAKVEKYDPSAVIPEGLYTKWFDYDKIIGSIFVRNRRDGDHLVIDPYGHKKKLKKYFIDEKVDASKRDSVLLLADNDQIIWVVGMRISAYYKVSDNTRRVLKVQYIENN
ncbi:MAG: tRNA lysidine(34) synthetase TilS [Lachnospiraceae bacterium]|nr:tRNA lysidine(34) synthetase TilS [Lachnospiraceae bacterium]